MKIEHLALQVPDPAAMAAWYIKHLGCSLARSSGEPAFMHFIKDGSGAVMLELYRNPRVPVPNYEAMDPLLLHLAWLSPNPAADRDRLLAAGATLAEDLTTTPAGDQLIMLREPWNIPLQLVKRVKPMLA